MARKSSKAKVNRRVKRSVRKTVGVLTLIMAIIVAAIPTPGVSAGNDDADDTTVPAVTYMDGSDAERDTSIPSLVRNNETIHTAKMIYQTSDGRYEMWNAYNFYTTTVSGNVAGGEGGVICEYNPAYKPQNGTLKIDYNVVTKYPTFTEQQIIDFFKEDASTGQASLTDKELAKYYPDEWEQYEEDKEYYDTQKALHDTWAATANNTKPEPVVPDEPKKPSHQAHELSWQNQLIYFCDHETTLTKMNSQGTYQLMEVADKTASDSSSDEAIGTTIVYIPYRESNIGDTGNVANGFYSEQENSYQIRYIGDGAFKGVANIETLIIPDEIIQIGDNAFEGATGLTNVSAYAGIIGNQAFKNCTSLKNVTLSTGVKLIGTESFYGCNSLNSIVFPQTVEKIGKGAFAYCKSLSNLDMSAITPELTIDTFAFYECPALSTVSFGKFTKEIAKAAFAVDGSATGSWRNVEFPANVSVLGDYVLAGRTNLKTVVMPENYGSSKEVTLGNGFFKDCINLEWVEFPDNGAGSCGYVSFEKEAFQDVLTEGFYIRGPEKDARGQTASTRKSSWASGITYVYKDTSGKDQWEIGSGIYRFTVADNGVLTSCRLIDSSYKADFTDPNGNDGRVEVPSQIGAIKVTGIGPNCFNKNTDSTIYECMKTLVIEDGSNISTIESGAFKGFPSLETVYIGDSVTAIGNEAFADCTELKTVVFSTPRNNAYANFTIGTNAFATKGDSLEFYGDIVEGYAPFTWAMSEDNYMNQDKLLRVCYRSGTPEAPNLTVILDNETGLVTLIDYPHYDELSDEVQEKYEKYLSGNYSSNEEIALNADEALQLDHVLNIVIPAGVQSIDVAAYIDDPKNSNNITAYLTATDEDGKTVTDPYYATYRNYGLFNGFYGDYSDADGKREYAENNENEQAARGNDRVLTVTMNTIESLPDNAFYSCENLQSVVLGSALTDIGTAPFSGCRNLTSVGGNNKYTCNNGIIYENNDTGKTIVECLSSRGKGVGTAFINSETDPELKDVTQIRDAAFENCAEIMSVDLSDATGLQTIPKDCFHGASELNSVVLPASVNEINKGAFTDTRKYLTVTIPAKEVEINTGAFNDTAILRSYEDSAVERYAKMNGHQFEEIDKIFTVYFLDYDSSEIDVQHVEAGRAAKEPAHPKRDGYVFSGWSPADFSDIEKDTIVIAQYITAAAATGGPVTPGAGTKTTPTATPSTTARPTTSVSPTAKPASPTPTSTQQYKLTVVNGSGSGTYRAGTSVNITANIAPSGQTFINWTSTSNDFNIVSGVSSVTTITMPDHDLTITANFGYTPGSNTTSSNTSGNGSGTSTNGTNGNGASDAGNTSSNTGTVVDITKPGISNTDLASATVDGSTDNFVVKISDTAEARAAVEAALMNEYGSLDQLSYFAMDISLYDSTGTTKIEDTTGISVNITMPLPDDLIQYAGNNQVAGVVNGNVLDKLSPRFTTINGVPCISFTATHFSPYTIYVDRNNLSNGITDNTPKTGDLVHPKWFLVVALACTSMILLLKKDRKRPAVKNA